ncbi:hypothetical protein OA90_15545 [Labrenzia sp. OB1]|nr:hypothetical protein OA90_15545 [Labrenzia sp. OB1]
MVDPVEWGFGKKVFDKFKGNRTGKKGPIALLGYGCFRSGREYAAAYCVSVSSRTGDGMPDADAETNIFCNVGGVS